MSKKSRVKKLTLEDRRKIKHMAENRKDLGLTYAMIAKAFDVSKGRVSQIVNDNYNETELIE
tara:strand:- start:234 stop:419 length:186 start_codon:yes stop_codon:yes gene_type:complete